MAPSIGVFVSSILFFALLHLIRSQDDDEIWSVTGVSGRSSDLPCYFTPRIPGDRPKLILWYKESIKSPLFSHDNTRAPEKQTEQHQEGGGILTVTLGSAALTYQNVTPQHAGMYECRVDFYQSPAQTKLVNFSVVELPSSVQIIDRQTGHPRNGILGPYYPGQNIMLTCISLNGSPLPNITWWKDNRVISNVWEVTGPAKVQSDLTIDNVTRDWHNQTLTCSATNTHLAVPVSVTVLIQMYLLPLSVVISTPGAAREGQQTRLTCTVHGSRPPPIITWTLRGITKRAELKEKNHGLVSVSELLVNVTRADDNTRVKCTAENPAVPGAVLSNFTTLTVHYPPSVTASLGRSLRPDLLKEGDDVYFTCSVAANPPASTITWYHEEENIQHGQALLHPSLLPQGTVQVQNVSQGVIVSGESLVLQKVRRDKAGKYKCGASNALATVTSAPVHLKIRYKPECQTSPTTYFIYDKPINVTCTVSAHPPVQTITWQWNSSEEVVAIQQVRAGRLEQITAQLTVHPVESKEDRILSCWASNLMGKQEQACGFSIKVAEMPLPLSSCRLANITASSLSLTCQRPHVTTRGTTLYRAEVYFENRTLFANVTSNRPSFNVSRLDAGTSYQIKVYVTHGPVTSPPVVVSAYTSRSSRTPEKNGDGSSDGEAGGGGSVGGDVKEAEDTEDRGRRGSVISRMNGVTVGGVVGGVVGTVVLLVGAVWARHYCIVVRRRKMRRNASDEANPDVVPSVGTSYDHPSGPGEASRHRFWTKDAYPPGAGPSSAGDDDACAGGLSRQSIAEEDEDQDSDGDVGGGFPAAAARGARGVTGGNRHSIAAFMGGRGSDENVGGVRGMGTRNRHSFAGGVGAPGYSAGMSRHSFAGGPVRHSLSGGFGRHSMGGGGMPGGGMAAGGGLSGGVTVPRTGGAINRHSYGGRQGSAGSLGGVGGLGSPGRLGGVGSPVRVGSATGSPVRVGSAMSGGSGGRMASLGSAGRLASPGSSGSQTPVSGGGLSRHSFAGGIGQRPVGGTNRHSFAGGMSGQRSAGSLGSLGKVAGGSRHSYAGGFGSGAGGVVVNPLGQTFTLPARPRGEIFPGGSLPRSLKDIKMSTIARADVHCPVDQLMKSTETVV